MLILYEYSYFSLFFIIIVTKSQISNLKKGMEILMNTSKASKNTQKKRKQKSSDTTVNEGLLHTTKSALFGAMVGIVSAFVFMTAGAFVCYLTSDPNAFVDVTALVSLYISSLICGFAAVKKNRSSALLCGSLSGIFMMLFFVICSLFFDSNSEAAFDFPISVLLRVAMIAVSVLGGYLGTKKGSSRKKNRKYKH